MTRHSAATSIRISDCSKSSYQSTGTDGVATIRTIPSSSRYGLSSVQQQQQNNHPIKERNSNSSSYSNSTHELNSKHHSTSNHHQRRSSSSYNSMTHNNQQLHDIENNNNNNNDYENDTVYENNGMKRTSKINDNYVDKKETNDNKNEFDDDEEEEDDDDIDNGIDCPNRSTCAMLAGNGILNSSISSIDNNGTGTNNGTIALFGIYSRTGNHFLRLALDAGYCVRVYLLSSTSIIDPTTKKLKTITSSLIQDEFNNTDPSLLKWIPAKRFNDKQAIQRTIKNVNYVVCMLSDTVYTDTDNSTVVKSSSLSSAAQKRRSSTGARNSVGSTSKTPTNVVPTTTNNGILTNFIQTLYPLMIVMPTIQVFLYQATSLASNTINNGSTPMLSNIFKSFAHVTYNTKTSSFLYDQDTVMNEISIQHTTTTTAQIDDVVSKRNKLNKLKKNSMDQENRNKNVIVVDDGNDTSKPPHFAYIVTRPTTSFITDGPSTKKLAPTKSQPGPFTITHVDLADFSLNALLKRKLYNSCPYVVPDK